MQIDKKKIAQYTKTNKNGEQKENCTYIKFVRKDIGFGILAQLRQVGVNGQKLNRLVETALTSYLEKPAETKKN